MEFSFKNKYSSKKYEEVAPEIFSICKKTFKETSIDLDFLRINDGVFNECPNIPFDIAIMEKIKSGVVFPLDVGWNDVGSWESIWSVSKKDKLGNV